MEWINRYLYAVGKKVPAAQRGDIEKELESAILESLEAKFGRRAYTDEEVIGVLRDFGSPDKVAAGYRGGANVLIGPGMYSFYIFIVKIVLAAVALGLTISFFITIAADSSRVGEKILGLLTQFYASGLGAVGMLTIIFALVERLNPDVSVPSFQDTEGRWDPKKLLPVPDKSEKVKVSDSIAGICFTILAIALVNLLTQYVGKDVLPGFVYLPPLDKTALEIFAPFWNILLFLGLVKHILLLKDGRWRLGTRLYDIAIEIGNVAVTLMMIYGPILIADVTYENAKIQEIYNTIRGQYDTILTVIMVFTIIGIAVRIFKAIRASIR